MGGTDSNIKCIRLKSANLASHSTWCVGRHLIYFNSLKWHRSQFLAAGIELIALDLSWTFPRVSVCLFAVCSLFSLCAIIFVHFCALGSTAQNAFQSSRDSLVNHGSAASAEAAQLVAEDLYHCSKGTVCCG